MIYKTYLDLWNKSDIEQFDKDDSIIELSAAKISKVKIITMKISKTLPCKKL